MFTDWRSYESARAVYNALSKRWDLMKTNSTNLDTVGMFAKVMSEQTDFLHPRLNNSVILQNIQFMISTVTTSLWDGVSDHEVKLLIVELSKLCVPNLMLKSFATLLFVSTM